MRPPMMTFLKSFYARMKTLMEEIRSMMTYSTTLAIREDQSFILRVIM
jgi:hypothetical protein